MRKNFKITTDKPALSYKAGDKVVFSVFPRNNTRPLEESVTFRWTIRGDNGEMDSGTAKSYAPFVPSNIDRGQTRVDIESQIKGAGFLHLNVVALTADGLEDAEFDKGDVSVGADIEKLGYHGNFPDDFEDYWNEIKGKIAEFNCEITYKEPFFKGISEDFLCFDIRISAPEGQLASGYLSYPKKEGKYPLQVSFHGYSVCGSLPICEKDTICLDINALGLENGLTIEESTKKYPELELYGFSEEENESPYKTFWRGMAIRNLAAMKWGKTLDNWDGKNMSVTGGSQGGFQAILAAAHDESVNFCDVFIPWFCDLNAESFGFIEGWRPKAKKGLEYFDSVANAKYIKCPVKIEACLGDYTCPPAGIIALYKEINSKKSLDFLQGGTHGDRAQENEHHFMEFDPENPSGEIKGKYRHYKGGEYEVIGEATDSETLEPTIVYKGENGKLWARPKRMWNELVFFGGKYVRRFEKI